MHKVNHTVMVMRYSPAHLRPRWAIREATNLLSRGAGFSLARFFEFVASQSGHFVIGRRLVRESLGSGRRSDCYCRRPGCRLSVVDTIDGIASKSALAGSLVLLSAGLMDRRLGCLGTVVDRRPGAGYAPVGRTVAVNRGPYLVCDDYRASILRPVIRSFLVRSLGNDEYSL